MMKKKERRGFEADEELRVSFTPEVVAKLIADAELAALDLQGRGENHVGPRSQMNQLPTEATGAGEFEEGSTGTRQQCQGSQKFHQGIQVAMSAFFCGSPEGP